MITHVTMKDIARKLNISVSTVSRALRDDNTVADETRKKIKQCAEELHFKPNTLAASLRTKVSGIIGVVVPDMTSQFFALVMAGMEDEAERNNYTLISVQSRESYEKEVKAIHTLMKTRVDGILVALSKKTVKYDHFQEGIDSHIPIVLYDRICTGLLTDKVVCTDYKGAFDAVEYMIKTGCKRIAFFGSDSEMEVAKNRKKGYLDALRKYNMPVEKDLIIICDSGKDAKNIAPGILSMENPPDAILAINDSTASGILHVAKAMDINVPEQLSVCGFGDGQLAGHTFPSLTSVFQDPIEIGRQSMRILINKIKHPELRNKITNKVINTPLLLQGSTRTPKC